MPAPFHEDMIHSASFFILDTLYWILHTFPMSFALCSKNGTLIPLSEATMPVTNIEFAYGFGVYENIRVVRGTPLFVDDHLARLQRSAEVIGLTHTFTVDKIKQWIMALIHECASDALNLKLLLIGGREAKDATLFILPLAPLFPERKLYRDGVSAITVRYERSFPDAKTLSMLGSYVAYRRAKAEGAYDALLIDHHGNITEGTRTNFFCIKDRTIISAPIEKILEGVTMKHVLTVAKNHGFTIEERDITPLDLPSFDGAFLTSTSSKILPLRQIDALNVPIPGSLQELMTHYSSFLDEGMTQ